MEMHRRIYDDLLAWKESADRKPLILLGARQVGKTFILKKFGEKEYRNMVYINCHHNPFAESLFERDFDIQRIISSISIYYKTKITPGETLLFFDEIQEVPNGVTSLKYFCEEARDIHVAVAGSLLGITLRHNESYPVGKVNTLRMYPMTFSEFMLASDETPLLQAIEREDWPLLEGFVPHLTDLLRRYYFVGGMPEVVVCYLTTHDVYKTRAIQQEIIDSYLNDMSKHTATEAQRIHAVWRSVPSQLAKENKKFVYKNIAPGARAREYEMAIQWLVDAGLIYKIERTATPVRPLKFYADPSAFKIYMNDCGLLAAMSEAEPREMLLGDNLFREFKGAFTENYVLQQLVPQQDLSVYYFSKEKSTQEIDFLVQTPLRIIPVEVKAEENVKSKSLSVFINADHKQLSLRGVRCSMKPYMDQGWMENIPLFAVESFFSCQARS